jgi:hypothetical protein
MWEGTCMKTFITALFIVIKNENDPHATKGVG